MCGIVGVRSEWLGARGLAPRPAIERALDALRWRGPDGLGSLEAGGWLLGCARLAISGPAPTQPVARRGGRLVGVMNGAVTNARELWAQWLPGVERREAPPNDAWLPLLAIERGDQRALAALQGHHAYAVVDTASGDVHLGQDRFGERPLWCVVEEEGGGARLVAFASTLAALRQLGLDVPEEPERVAQWFRYGWADVASQPLTGGLRVCELPARGAPFVAGSDASGPAPWARVAAPPAPRTPAARGGLAARLEASVRRCLDSPSKAGLFLSGGLDSSCLALCVAANGAATPAYQFRADGVDDGERRSARAVAAAADLRFVEVDGGPELLDALPRLTRLAGQPLGDPSVLAAHAVARAAADDGARILLAGEGADELLLGYRRYVAAARLPRLGWPAWLRRLGRGWSTGQAARCWRAATAPNPIRALLAVTPPAFGARVLAASHRAHACWQDAEAAAPGSPHPALASRDDDLAHYLPRDLLPKLDVALLAAGVEGRCPYLEGEFFEFGASRAMLGKRALRAAFAARLPEATRRLPKRGFSLPLNDWFRRELPALDVLAEPRSRERAHLQPGGAARAVDLHRSGRADLGHGLYLLYAYELHLRALEGDA
jgi:asparagine synthase (glutamine-hydrolysing)